MELGPLRGGRGPGGAALPAPPPHAQHPLLRPLPRTPPRCSAHVGYGRRLKRWEERLEPTLLPRRRALGARSLWRWRTRIGSGGPGTFPGRPALVPMPSSPAACPHHSITPPSLLRALDDPASSSLMEDACQAGVFRIALQAPAPTPQHTTTPPHTP